MGMQRPGSSLVRSAGASRSIANPLIIAADGASYADALRWRPSTFTHALEISPRGIPRPVWGAQFTVLSELARRTPGVRSACRAAEMQ